MPITGTGGESHMDIPWL